MYLLRSDGEGSVVRATAPDPAMMASQEWRETPHRPDHRPPTDWSCDGCIYYLAPEDDLPGKPTIAYKLTFPDGDATHGGAGRWSLPRGTQPGSWREISGPLKPDVNGLHLLRPQDVLHWIRTGTLWEVQIGGEWIDLP